jgi:hypothetical protein
MSTARSELLIFMVAALATTIGLFVVHTWYATYLDVSFHAKLDEGQPSEALLAARDAQHKALNSGKIPLTQAMDALAKRGRSAASSIAPVASNDLSAVSGWIHRPGFKPVTAHPVRTAPVAKVAPAPVEAAPDPLAPAAPAPTNVIEAKPVPGSTRIRTATGSVGATAKPMVAKPTAAKPTAANPTVKPPAAPVAP